MNIKSIEVHTGYRGAVRTHGQYIAPGHYDVDDPRLFGQAEFLVSSGRAVVTAEFEPIEVEPEATDDPITDDESTEVEPTEVEPEATDDPVETEPARKRKR